MRGALLEQYASACSEEDGAAFRICLESHLFQSISGHILIGLSDLDMSWAEKREYIKRQLSSFFELRLLPKADWFYSTKEKMVYVLMRMSMYDALILLDAIYHVRHRIK